VTFWWWLKLEKMVVDWNHLIPELTHKLNLTDSENKTKKFEK
jgi:hypothetical protein